MFNTGCENVALRKGASRILEKIKWAYPHRLDLPSETEIRQAISTLMSKMNSGKDPNLSSSRGIAMPYLETVVSIFVHTVHLKNVNTVCTPTSLEIHLNSVY